MNALNKRQTARLLLFRMREADLDDLTRMHLDPRVMVTLGGVRSPAETKEWLARQTGHWQRHGFGLWMARDRATGQFVGRGGLHHTEIDGQNEVEVGYSLLPDFWGRGLATELACESVHTAFTVLHLAEIVCFTMTTNLASQRVMQKVGFRYEREMTWKDLPHVFYRLTEATWRASAEAPSR